MKPIQKQRRLFNRGATMPPKTKSAPASLFAVIVIAAFSFCAAGQDEKLPVKPKPGRYVASILTDGDKQVAIEFVVSPDSSKVQVKSAMIIEPTSGDRKEGRFLSGVLDAPIKGGRFGVKNNNGACSGEFSSDIKAKGTITIHTFAGSPLSPVTSTANWSAAFTESIAQIDAKALIGEWEKIEAFMGPFGSPPEKGEGTILRFNNDGTFTATETEKGVVKQPVKGNYKLIDGKTLEVTAWLGLPFEFEFMGPDKFRIRCKDVSIGFVFRRLKSNKEKRE